MKQRNMLYTAILLLTSLLVGTLANGTKNVFQRRLDIDDGTPLTSKESTFFKSLFNRGIIRSGEGVEVSFEPHRRVLKGSKSSKKEKKTLETVYSSKKGPTKLVFIPGDTISQVDIPGDTISKGFTGKGGKGRTSTTSKKTSKKCKKGKGKGKGDSTTSTTSKSSKKSSKGYCESEEVELFELVLYFAHENATSIVIPTGATNEFDWGVVYTYDAGAFMAHHNSPIITNNTGVLDSNYTNYTIKSEDLIGNVTGRCTRIDPNAQSSSNFTGVQYCELSYGFSDSEGFTYLTAEGVMPGGGSTGTLAITGGTGVFRRVVGQLLIKPKDGPNSSVYLEVLGNLWLDSRVVDRNTYDELTEES